MSKRKNLNDVIHGDRAEVRKMQGNLFGGGNKDKFDSWSGGSVISMPSDKHKHGGGGGRCYETHPGLILPGTAFVMYGGACRQPVVGNADVYIGLDYDMKWTPRHWPWKQGAEVLFTIPDMGVPANVEEFKKLVSWAKKQIEAGLKVHAGCMGGHGRTGMLMAAIVAEFGEKDAIQYVRDHYCVKAVESNAQVEFLHQHWGITKVTGYKQSSAYTSQFAGHRSSGGGKGKGSKKKRAAGEVFEQVTPLRGAGSIWGTGVHPKQA